MGGKSTLKTHPLLQSKGIKPRRGTVKTCRQCGKEFYAGPCHSKRVFCSMECSVAEDKEGAFSFACVICHTRIFTQPYQIIHRARGSCSIQCRSKVAALRAELNARWNPPTPAALSRRLRYSKRMDDWRLAVFERDDYTCQGCGQKGGYLQADHIKPFAFFPESRFELSNGRTLCLACHKKTPTFGRAAIKWAESQRAAQE